MDQVGRIGGQCDGGFVDRDPAIAVGRQRTAGEAVRGHHGQVGSVFAGKTSQPAAAGRPTGQQQVQRVQRPGGEHHLGVGHTGERSDGGASRVENRFGRLGRNISADLGLVPRVPGGGVEHGEALP